LTQRHNNLRQAEGDVRATKTLSDTWMIGVASSQVWRSNSLGYVRSGPVFIRGRPNEGCLRLPPALKGSRPVDAASLRDPETPWFH
jgi:hypothetical protein